MNAYEKRILNAFRLLNSTQQQTLQDFADFLLLRSTGSDSTDGLPKQIAPAENESVIAALKRYAAMYPMLDKAKMLPETSELISQHVMLGRDKDLIINEIDRLFKQHYQAMCENSDDLT